MSQRIPNRDYEIFAGPQDLSANAIEKWACRERDCLEPTHTPIDNPPDVCWHCGSSELTLLGYEEAALYVLGSRIAL